jgi:hypothetical protein
MISSKEGLRAGGGFKRVSSKGWRGNIIDYKLIRFDGRGFKLVF